MSVSILLAICLGLAVDSLAQPHPCKSPPFMQGHSVVIYPSGDYYSLEEFFYDGAGQRVKRRAMETVNNNTIYREELMLYQEGVYYEIYHHNKTCTKAPFKVKWFPIEVPGDASFQKQFVMGSLSDVREGLLINSWTGQLPQFKAKYLMTFTEFGCLPLSINLNIENVGYIVQDFYDIVVGIEDPGVFFPPPFCDKASDRGETVTDFIDTLVNT
ncbi:ependymin [Osmerus mordax]|uniref:ependymin n=1 Tax=Osmerus mordax TaxID=8014 RepID=UPI00350FB2F9